MSQHSFLIRAIPALFAALILSTAIFPASASPMHYTIAYTPGVGPLPTGSFDYDGNLVKSQQFSNFLVDWNSLTFDLTSVANNFAFYTDTANLLPSSCAGAAENDAFLLLSNAPCVSVFHPTRYWQAFGDSFVAAIDFEDFFSPPQAPEFPTQALTASFYFPPITSTVISSGYGYTTRVVGVSVPEPATLPLLGLGLAGLGLSLKRKSKERSF